jgi:hypothetical protein
MKIILTERQLQRLLSENMVDNILDKINNDGMESLSGFERDILKNKKYQEFGTMDETREYFLMGMFDNLTPEDNEIYNDGEIIDIVGYFDVEDNLIFHMKGSTIVYDLNTFKILMGYFNVEENMLGQEIINVLNELYNLYADEINLIRNENPYADYDD